MLGHVECKLHYPYGNFASLCSFITICRKYKKVEMVAKKKKKIELNKNFHEQTDFKSGNFH